MLPATVSQVLDVFSVKFATVQFSYLKPSSSHLPDACPMSKTLI